MCGGGRNFPFFVTVLFINLFFCEIVFIPGVSKGGGAQHGGEVRCGNSIQQTTSMLLSVSLCKVENEYEEVLHVEKLLV